MVVIEKRLEVKYLESLNSLYMLFETDTTLLSRIVKFTNFSREEVYEIWKEFIKYLFVKSFNPDKYISPSYEVDLLWHCFIIHTQLYTEFCNNHFWCYIHHRPLPYTIPLDTTKSLMLDIFWEINEKYWINAV